uniref:Small ribosomal subunit protein uS7m n=1 Tax=Steinernema glaseri TaxID=37863 RepID=A0A1I8AVA9_9BILA
MGPKNGHYGTYPRPEATPSANRRAIITSMTPRSQSSVAHRLDASDIRATGQMLASGIRRALSSSSARSISTSSVNHDRYDPKLFTEPVTNLKELSEPVGLDDPRSFMFIKSLKTDQSPVFYRDHVVDKIVRVFMKDGKKEIQRRNVLEALEIVKRRQYKMWLRAKTEEEKAAIELDPFAVANKAILNCRPLMKLLGVTRGGTTYRVPFPIPEAEAEFRAMKMMRDICRQKAKKGETSNAESLASELLAASKNEGLTIQMKQELHKLCEANRAYAHYRS